MSNSRKLIFLASLLSVIFVLPGCAVIGGIFKAGVWVGVLAVVIVIGLILFLVSRGSGKN